MAGHAGRLNAVKLGAGGTMALTVSDDYTARVWDLPSGRCVHVLKGACNSARSHAGYRLPCTLALPA